MIKQKIIKSHSGNDLKTELEIALDMGWLVHTVACNSASGVWIAVIYREATNG